MLAPYLFLLIAFGLVPLLMAVREVPGESLTNPDGGWDAFKIVVQDFRFPQAVKNVLGFMAIYVPLTLVLVIVMALMLDVRHTKWSKYLRMAYIIPASISGAVAVLVWWAILEPTISPIKSILSLFGIESATQIWQTKNLVYIIAIMTFFTIAGNWILIQYGSLQSISSEIIEAARVDGGSDLTLYRSVAAPLLKPGIATVAVFTALGTWNEFLLAMIYIQNESYKTIPIGLLAYSSRYSTDYQMLFAALTVVTIPMIVVYLVFNRQIVAGLTEGSLK